MSNPKWPALPGVEMDDAAWEQFNRTGSLRMAKRADGILVPADPLMARAYAMAFTEELVEDMGVAHPDLRDFYERALKEAMAAETPFLRLT